MRLTRRAALAGGGAALLATPALDTPALARPVGRDLPGLKLTAFLPPGASPPSLSGLPGLRRSVINRVELGRAPGAPYGTVVEMWFATGSAGPAPDFGAGALLMATHEVEIRSPPPGAMLRGKRMGLVRGLPGESRAAFQDGWREKHALIANAGYRLRRYALNLALGEAGGWDGYAELWWDSFEDMAESGRRIAADPGREPVSPFGGVLLLPMTEVG